MIGDPRPVDCAIVDQWLDDWLGGRVAEPLARTLDHHVSTCARCQRLVAIVRDEELWAEDLDESPRGLVSAVRDQTTGSPCARAEAQLPALVDGELEAGSREILAAHLAHCDGCSRLHAALQEAARVLPALAEIQTPPGFAEGVMRATTAAPMRPAFGGVLWEWTRRVLSRPRASLELAYVATLLLVVLLGNPVAAFYQVEQHASALAGAVPVAHLSEQLGVGNAAAGTFDRMLAGVASVVNAVRAQATALWDQARSIVQRIGSVFGDAIAWLTHVDVRQLLRITTPPRGQPAGRAEPGGHR